MGPTAASGVRQQAERAGGRPEADRSAGQVNRPPDSRDSPDRSWSSSERYGTGMPAGATSVDSDHEDHADTDHEDDEAVSRTLPADPSSVRRAREVVRDTLAGWRADAIYDDVVLVASELVSNALQHGLEPGRRGEKGTVELSLRRDGEHVICAVTDPSPQLPVRRPKDVLAGSGHGLQLVDSLSLCWGWNVHDADHARSGHRPAADPPKDVKAVPAQRRGKSVWAVFPLRMPSARARGAA